MMIKFFKIFYLPITKSKLIPLHLLKKQTKSSHLLTMTFLTEIVDIRMHQYPIVSVYHFSLVLLAKILNNLL